LLRWSGLLDHDDLRLRLRLLSRLLLRLIVAHVIKVVGISAKQNWYERILSATAIVTGVRRRVVALSPGDRRQVRVVESQTGHAVEAD
jgi:hypothetical protein